MKQHLITIGAKVSPATKRELKRRAEASGMSVSAYLNQTFTKSMQGGMQPGAERRGPAHPVMFPSSEDVPAFGASMMTRSEAIAWLQGGLADTHDLPDEVALAVLRQMNLHFKTFPNCEFPHG